MVMLLDSQSRRVVLFFFFFLVALNQSDVSYHTTSLCSPPLPAALAEGGSREDKIKAALSMFRIKCRAKCRDGEI